MPNYIRLPNGAYYEANEGLSYQDAVREAYKYYPQAFGEQPEETPKKSGVTGALGLGAESLLSSFRTAAGAITDPNQAAREALERQKALGEKYAEPTSLERVKKAYEEQGLLSAAKEVASQIPTAIAEQAPQLGTMFGGARLGAMAGAPLGPVGSVVGGVAGAGAALLPQFFGSNIERQAAEQAKRGEELDINRTAALGSAAGQAALEAAGTAFVFGGRLVSKLTKIPEEALLLGKGNAQKLADERLRDVILKGTGRGFAAELPVEIAQQMTERAQAGLSLTDADALTEYGQTAYQVGLLSPLGIAGRVSDRAGAREEVARTKAEEAARAAQEAEAAKSTPEALTKLYDDFTQLQQRRDALDAQIKELKPVKGATEEQRQAYEAVKAERSAFMRDEFVPVAQEYSKRKGAIEKMMAERQSALETEGAAEQPTAKLPLPSDLPEAKPFQLSPTARLMDDFDRIRAQHDQITTKLAEGPDLDTQATLNEQRRQLEARMAELAPAIEERGGITDTQADFEKKMKEADKQRLKLLAEGDFDGADKVAARIKDMQARLPFFQELASARATPQGATQNLFAEAPAPVKTEAQLEQERQTREEEQNRALYGREAKKASAEQAFGEAGIGPRGQLEQAPAVPEPKAAQVIQPKQLESVEKAKADTSAANQELATAAKTKDTDAIYAALDKVNQAENATSRAQADVGRPTLKPAIIDIFDPANIIRNAIQNGDTKLLSDMAAHSDRTVLTQALDQKTDERTRLINVLESKLDLAGTKRERADLFSQIYDSKQQAQFKNGTFLDKRLQDIYDKGGPAAVESEWVADKVEPLMKKVTTPQGNAKKSLYQQLIETAAEHAEALAQLESGIATPTMREKTAALQAKLGKGEAPAERPMNESEKYQLQRRITALENKYKMIEGKVTPIRDEILKTYSSLYKTVPLEKPSVAKAKERAEAEAEARKPKAKSRTASVAARLARGDVRPEAESSPEMRKLAMDLGEQAPEYEKFSADMLKRAKALEAKYGKNDPAVTTFRLNMADELKAKALALGKKTPEYKATLKEQIAYLQEVFPTAGKQEVPTKRTGAVTRKQSAAPSRLVTSSPESRATSEAEALRERRRLFKDFEEAIASEKTAYRFGEKELEQVIDPAEAQKVIDGLKLPENVKFVYAATPGQIPVRILRQIQKDGVDPTTNMMQGAVFRDGTVLVVGDQHANIKDLEETIAHELIGHYGVDTVIGLNRLQEYANNTDVLKLAEQVGGSKLQAEVKATMDAMRDQGEPESVQKLQGIRELIAHTEEVRMSEGFRDRAKRWLKEFIGMVREGLRKMGLKNYAEASASDVFYMLRASRRAFASGQIGPYRGADGRTAFRLKREPSNSVVATEPSFADKFLGNVMGLAGRVQFVDQYAALDAAIKKGLTEGQITSLEAVNAQYLMRFAQQRSQYAGQFLTNGPLKLELTRKDGITTSLFRSTKGVNMIDVANALNEAKLANSTEQENMFTVYLAGERAKRVGWEKLNFSDPAKAKAEYDSIMAKLDADPKAKAAFEKAKKLYQQYNAGLLDFLVETGVMTPGKAAELKAITYVPYYRVNKNGEVQLMIDRETPVRISNIKDEPQLQSLVGGNEQIMPVFTSAVQNTFMIANMGLRNQTVKETSFLLQKLGVASRVAPGKGPANANVVRFKKNGADYYALIDTDLYGIPADLIVKGMEGIKTTTPAIVRLMGLPANVLRKFVTRMPAYAVRQIIRDPLNAWLTTGTDATPVLSSMKELATMVAGRNETEKKLMETGAISSNVFSGDEQDMAKFLKDISAGKSLWDKTMAKADAFAMQGDAATRAVIYKDSIAKGMSEQEALLRTLESMNFSRRGVSPSMQMLSVMIPFFNAQIQGLDVIYRAYKGDMPFSEQLKIKEKMMARGLLMAIGTLAYAALMSDDEAYKRAKPEERFANWFVYVPGVSEPVRVPIPFELGFLFKALPEAVYGMAANDEKGGKTLSGLGKLLGQTNPFSLPQAVKPITEVVLGKSFFQGDIESAREKDQLATDRYRANSTEVAKLLGKVTGQVGISPIQIDYLIRGYFGGLGIAIVQIANPILAADQKEIAQPSTKPSKLPFIGGLFQPIEGRGTLDEAYDRMQEIKQIKGSYNRLVEDGKKAEAQAFAQTYANDLAQASVSGAVQKQLGELAKQERMIKADPKLTQEQKDERLERLDQIKIRYARQFLAISDRTTRP